jgi:hypothetical protein
MRNNELNIEQILKSASKDLNEFEKKRLLEQAEKANTAEAVMLIYDKNKKLVSIETDEQEIYKSLMYGLKNKYLNKSQYIRSIKSDPYWGPNNWEVITEYFYSGHMYKYYVDM